MLYKGIITSMNIDSPLEFDESGTYRTNPKKSVSLLKIFPECFFYPKLFSIIFFDSGIAKRGAYDKKAWAKTSFTVLQALEKIGMVFEITGVNHFSSLKGPCVFVGNHMSALETAVLPVVIDPIKPVTFIVKESLVNYPVFKHIMRATNPITVTRTNPREDFKRVMKEGLEKLSAGISIVVFPQTTRAERFNPSEFNSIGVKLAKNGAVPIIPFALKTDAWHNGKIIRDFGRLEINKGVFFAFGEPIFVKDRGSEEQRKIIDFIENRLNQWKDK